MKTKFLIFFYNYLITYTTLFFSKKRKNWIINMEYILSKMEDYTTANQQLEEKIGKWKNEID